MVTFFGLSSWGVCALAGEEVRIVPRGILEIRAVLGSSDVEKSMKQNTTIDAVLLAQDGYDLISGDCTLHVRVTPKNPEPKKVDDFALVIDPLFCTK